MELIILKITVLILVIVVIAISAKYNKLKNSAPKCNHKYEQHAKDVITRTSLPMYMGQGSWKTEQRKYTNEILICKHCGKIERITY